MSDQTEPKLGINSWLQEELYQTYLNNKKNVDDSWRSVFENGPTNGHTPLNGQPVPVAVSAAIKQASVAPAAAQPSEELVPLRGVAAKIAENMAASLSVPTATSQRAIPVRKLDEMRQAINRQRAAAGASKLSYTHLISWAILRTLDEFPTLNHAFTEQNHEPFRIARHAVNFGLAVDVKAKDGSSSLMVPNIKDAGKLGFAQFIAAFDDVVSRARSGKLQMPDFQGTSISLTNPGTVGTLSSVPRLMPGQGAIIATGAMDYPPGYENVSPEAKASLGLSKVMMVTSTYDHRIIQGAESGRFLAKLEALLNGENGFYDNIFRELGIGAVPAISAAPAAKTSAAVGISEDDAIKEAAVSSLIHAYRVRGHFIADLDPLGSKRPPQPDLEPATYGFTDADMDRRFVGQNGKTLREILDHLRKTYCDKVACDYMHIHAPEQRDWLRTRMESTENRWALDTATRYRILDRLMEAEEFEHFLHKRFFGKKRFSLEGGESTIVALDQVLELAANGGAQEAVMGMAHRGRLTILANIVGKPLPQVFAEFEEAPTSTANAFGSGDVKYHLGASGVHKSSQGKDIVVTVAFNPSHLEAVDPVVEGMVRPKQDRLEDTTRDRVIPILIHGDAAFAGQGVVPETLNLSQLAGYTTGGTVHLIINNQLGFTTSPEDGHSGPYCSDIARSVQAPIFHVNGDDPEAVFRVSQLAFEYRQQFHRDAVIDLVCYRRYGHNETDEPSYTQPVMYAKIRQQPSVTAKYSAKLIGENIIAEADLDARRQAYVARLSNAYDETKKNAEAYELQDVAPAPLQISSNGTAIDQARAELVINGMTSVPEGFHLHPKSKPFLEHRKQVLTGAPMDWAAAEAIAFGSLVVEGYGVRLSGQDSGRGTFNQRHAELFDYENGQKYTPLQNLPGAKARFEVWGSSLSEYAVMGFEFGFSVADPMTLVMWEGQFGDFVNGAQIIVDQFLSSAETKWGTPSGLVLLLPHGYEGMGPEHSSARIERFLQLCAENNMQVANCSTPAQYFHLLRRQMKGSLDGKPIRKPLIVFTPKSMLRHPRAVSQLSDLTSGGFQEILPDPSVPANGVKRVLLCSGKIYYDLLEGREKRSANHVAIVRLEQMYPFPKDALQSILDSYGPGTEVYWVQEEPRNMGPWRFMLENIQPILDTGKRQLRYAGRPESASPAAGTEKRHKQEQAEIVEDSFAAQPVTRKPKGVKLVAKKKK